MPAEQRPDPLEMQHRCAGLDLEVPGERGIRGAVSSATIVRPGTPAHIRGRSAVVFIYACPGIRPGSLRLE